MNKYKFFLFVLGFLISSVSALGQSDSLKAHFLASPDQQYGFDDLAYTLDKEYEVISIHGLNYKVPYKSVASYHGDSVLVTLSGRRPDVYHGITMKVNDSIIGNITLRDSDTIAFQLPEMQEDYSLNVFANNDLIGKLNVRVYPSRNVSLIVVPLTQIAFKADSLEHNLNTIFGQSCLSYNVHIAPFFQPDDFENGLLNNPSPQHDRYTEQMTDLRDKYFESHPPTGAYYVFIVDGFVDERLTGFMVRNKAISFVKNTEDDLYSTIAKQLGYGVGVLNDSWLDNGPEKGTTMNLMDTTGGSHLTFSQWELIRHSFKTVAYFDDYEDVETNNGLIAYYFWEEDENGNIQSLNGSFLKAIKRPFKRNQYSLHLDINNWFFVPLFRIERYDICLLHILLFVLCYTASVYVRRKLIRKLMIKRSLNRLYRWVLRSVVFVCFMSVFVGGAYLVNRGYLMFEVKSGQLAYLGDEEIEKAIKMIGDSKNTERLEERKMGSEILIRKNNEWVLERRKKVLYFDVRKEGGKWTKCTFKTDSDTLTIRTKEYNAFAESHYFVMNYLDENDEYVYQKVFNHLGKEITDKLELDDPAQRILLFVNGYRPTSLGKSFEENFADIRKNGLEFPNSGNRLYSFDRYDYWRPWKEIDLLFQLRLNPTQTVYADGHFSVSTSNHRSLLSFSTLSALYPQRCEGNNHICEKTTVSSWKFWGAGRNIKTAELHALDPNKKGFESRRTNGKIAGRNLQQMLNELPNGSANDTLYIVAHSMGYAYTLGIVEQLRGKINFGGLYIIAPENASAGKVVMSEWKEIWQYGSNFEENKEKAPCLLDGIAPQVGVGGLKALNRAYIPKEWANRMGFYDSHFIGNYTWIFDIPKGEPGYIRQR